MPRYDINARFVDDDYFPSEDDNNIIFDERGDGNGEGGMQRRGRRGRGDGCQPCRRVDPRAEEYNRFLGLGPPPDVDDDIVMDDEYRRFPPSSASRRRWKGFAYKYNDIDLLDDEMLSTLTLSPRMRRRMIWTWRGSSRARGRRDGDRGKSAQLRWIESRRGMPSHGVPMHRSGSPLDMAAMDALRDIKKTKKYLERKEDDVEDAKEKVVSLKA